MPPRTTDEYLGTAAMDPPGDVVAGAWGTWTLTYTAGLYGVDEGGTLRVARRFCSDWGPPQMIDPAAPHYTTVRLHTDGTAKVRVRYDRKAFVRPWQKCVVVDIIDGTLAPGDRIEVIFGDRTGGSPGIRMQTFRETRHEWRMLVDCYGTGMFHRLDTSPVHSVVPGEPAKLVAIAREFNGQRSLHIKEEDIWGNPIVDGPPLSCEQEPFQGDRVRVTDARQQLEAISNSTRLNAWAMPDGTTLHALWGDPHGQTEETVGTGTLEEYFAFARDQSQLDFTGHQGNDFQITDVFWQRLSDVCNEFNEEGEFVVLLGEEWSGNTVGGGDRNVYFLEGRGPLHRSSCWQIDNESEASGDAYPVDQLFAKLRALPDVNGRPAALVVPHIGGRYADLAWRDERLEPVIEICSAWGVFEWQIAEAFSRGYQVGFTAASDGHKGRPGSSYPGAGTFGIYGGLTCAWAAERTREGVWDAYFARRTVATTGARILLQVEASIGGAPCVPLGGQLPFGDEVKLAIRVAGTAPLDRVEVFQGTECVKSWLPTVGAAEPSDRFLIVWSGARLRGRGRQVRWDGGLRVSGARIQNAQTYSFDILDEGLTDNQNQAAAFLKNDDPQLQQIHWKSSTTGDEDGVIVDLADVRPDAQLHLQTPLLEQSWNAADITLEPQTVELGGELLQVQVRRLPSNDRPWDTELETTLGPPEQGAPLWVRVTQTDGHRAWSSPIYIAAK